MKNGDFMHYKTYLSIVGGLVGAVAVSGAALTSPRSAAVTQATAANASVTVASTCSMTATINQAHSAEIPNGTFRLDIGKTTLQTFCNDAGGYAIYAAGYTGEQLGTNTLTDASLGATHDIQTGTTLDGSVSNWAMKVSPVDGVYKPTVVNNYDSYHTVPSAYEKVARFDATTDQDTVGSSVETTYGVSISQSQPAGNYEGKVKYALVHPGGAAAPTALVMQDVNEWKETLLIGEEITVTDSRDNKAYTVARLCTEYTNNECTDSQIWMTQNLDFVVGKDADNNPITLDSTNTDLNTAVDGGGNPMNGYTDNGTVITWTPKDTLDTPATITNYTTGSPANSVSGWVNDYSQPYQGEGGDRYYYNGTLYESIGDCEAAHHTEAECRHYQVGNYYNWPAAIASNQSQSYYADNYTVAPNSICPAGWRLPNGPTDNSGTKTISDFNKLLNANGVTAGNDDGTGSASVNVGYQSGGWNKINTKPLWFTRAGALSDSTFYDLGYGSYWSSTAQSSSSAYTLHFGSGGVWPAYRSYRVLGRSIRCVAR